MNAYLFAGLRSPFGRHAGSLAAVRPDDLAAQVMAAVVKKYALNTKHIEDVILGCTNQAGEDSRNVARNAALVAGLPVEVGGITVNRLCASGLAAVIDAARTIHVGEAECILAGGTESMTRAPFVMAKAESAYQREAKIFDTTMGARFPNPIVTARYGVHTMPETGDNVAADFGISREAADTFALGSQKKYAAAKARGFFADEITPIELAAKKKNAANEFVSEDEHPRADVSMDGLAKLRPLFPNGVVTAGNASGINDGAAILVIGSAEFGKKSGLRPLARIVASGVAGVEPRIMGVGPVQAVQKALTRAKLKLSDMGVVEINEAFASQVLSCAKLLEMSFDDSRLNPNGGAIAVGHPLGASGARLALTAARHMSENNIRYGVVSLCIGLGQGLALVLEKM